MAGVTRRARSEADKELRRAAILDAARDVFDAVEFDEFTMDAVATSLGLAKGTLYRYVPTREALLLALLTDEYTGWFDAVDLCMRDAPADSVAPLLVDELLERPRLMRLMSMMSSVLERNVPFDTAREFKVFLLARSTSVAALLAERLGCTPVRATQLLVHLHALAVGLYHHTHPAPVVCEVLADPALAVTRIDLRTELRHGIAALVAATRA